MTVNLPAKTLDEGIKNMMNTAKMDYEMWSTHTDKGKISDYTKEVLDKWDTNVKVLSGKNSLKLYEKIACLLLYVKMTYLHLLQVLKKEIY
jgi:glycogen synthase